jgi:hypothetical protein
MEPSRRIRRESHVSPSTKEWFVKDAVPLPKRNRQGMETQEFIHAPLTRELGRAVELGRGLVLR